MQYLGTILSVSFVLVAILAVLYLKKKHPYIYVMGEPVGFFLAGLLLLTHIVGLKECLVYSAATLCFAHAWQSLKEYLAAIENDIRQNQKSDHPAHVSTPKLFLSQFTALGLITFGLVIISAGCLIYALLTGTPL